MKLPEATPNARLTTPEVWKIDTLQCAADDLFEVTFESTAGRWRQGVWFGLEGTLEVDGSMTAQVLLWEDTAPKVVQIKIAETRDGLLRLYNIWDSGRGAVESRSPPRAGWSEKAIRTVRFATCGATSIPTRPSTLWCSRFDAHGAAEASEVGW